MKYYFVATHVKYGKVYIDTYAQSRKYFFVSRNKNMLQRFKAEPTELSRFRFSKG